MDLHQDWSVRSASVVKITEKQD